MKNEDFKKLGSVEYFRKVREELLEEYERRSDEFANYAEFINGTIDTLPADLKAKRASILAAQEKREMEQRKKAKVS